MTTPNGSGPTAARRRSGLQAKRWGELFETLFQHACGRRGLAITRIPDGCRQVGPRRLMRVKSPFDWVITHGGRTALIDTKTLNERNFPNSSIDQHQLGQLLPHELRDGVAGYVIWLRPNDRIVFIPASTLAGAVLNRGSLTPDSPGVVDLGSSKFMDAFKIFVQTVRKPRGESPDAGPGWIPEGQ